MKIKEILKEKKTIFSCEFYPPKTSEGIQDLYKAVYDLKNLGPGYISVTYGAGGSTREKTVEMVSKIKQEIGIEAMAHLTCVGHSKNEIKEVLNQIKDKGIENIIALRGDPPKGEKNFMPHPDGFKNAHELTGFIHGSYDFCIAVAGYPEGHIEAPSKAKDWDYLEKKVHAGADFIVTQLFFNNADFFNFEKEMRKRGVVVPIIPGIMPITNFHQIVKFTQMCGATIPEVLLKDLESVQDNGGAVEEKGVEFATKQCEELILNGVKGIHFYTLNKSKATKKIIENLKEKHLI
ncbi:MAG: methylenetetrahydrofolate reductase [NAD(P)H] [Elusimicrobia bacterium RIFCSPLOWO2_02_FULL_39_32]|nr:MAG: methylenetetrahydrofolate reductase [NAD(P)H] [Elusimicrobia bacterium RIFCSPHIGHO2_02_FULL_39_36]OGR91165.1 MAG: methylenetetrahydrofolate reductase [NAD(P)H] [Elusimicrobia bacterium RIFCSPLOWO2_02_FULL_39_32]OGS00133.1 MAG: methylenetetrahydrofolate reductase [NAD(P)H] [Elusimicrobia bacterium RIFCSPLOWO2_12_FULL_39_28]